MICGDNILAENPEGAGKVALERIKEIRPDFVIAGPAFNAGRYGIGCGKICELVQEELGVPAVTAMFEENVGAEVSRTKIYIIRTPDRTSKMDEILMKMGGLAVTLKEGREIPPSRIAHYLPRGIRKNRIVEKTGAERAIAMLLGRLLNQAMDTELPLPKFESVSPAPPIRDIKRARIALVTTTGIIPRENPDKMVSSRSESWFKYSTKGLDDLTGKAYKANHNGYDTTYVNADPNRALPLDMARELEKEKAFGILHDYFYTLSGQGTYVDAAKKIGESLGEALKKEGIDGVILTSA